MHKYRDIVINETKETNWEVQTGFNRAMGLMDQVISVWSRLSRVEWHFGLGS